MRWRTGHLPPAHGCRVPRSLAQNTHYRRAGLVGHTAGGLVTFSGTILGRVQRTCDHRGAKSVGYDYPPDDPIRDRYLAPEREHEASDVATHATFFPADVSVIEYLQNLHLLTKRVLLFALPLPVEGGDGAPARVIALQPKE